MTWKRLESRMREGPMFELILQEYLMPYKNRRFIFRYTYYYDRSKSRKANFVEIIGPSRTETSVINWDYRDDNLTSLYTSYNGLQEFERTAQKIIHLINIVLLIDLRNMVIDKLSFICFL